MLTIDPASMPDNGMYFLLNSTIAPRPVAWVSTVSATGVFNLAPHSYTTVLSPNPPIVGFVSVGRKDTLRNAAERGEFVYNIASETLVAAMNLTAADFPPDQSEFTWAGLTPVPSDLVGVPRVGEAAIAYECRLVEIIQVRATDNYLIMGEILRAHIDPAIMTNGRVDASKLRPILRLAGSQYAHLGEIYALQRPTYRGLLAEGQRPPGE